MAERQENNKPTKRTIEIWGRSLPGTMRQTTRSRAYSFRKAIFAPAPRRGLVRFPQSFANLTVLGKKDRRSLEVAAAVPWFWKKQPPEFADFRLFCACFNVRNVGKALCGAKNLAEWGQHLWRWNERPSPSERYYQTSAESLEVAFTLRSFLRKKQE